MLDVVEEVQLARLELRNLIQCIFCSESGNFCTSPLESFFSQNSTMIYHAARHVRARLVSCGRIISKGYNANSFNDVTEKVPLNKRTVFRAKPRVRGCSWDYPGVLLARNITDPSTPSVAAILRGSKTVCRPPRRPIPEEDRRLILRIQILPGYSNFNIHCLATARYNDLAKYLTDEQKRKDSEQRRSESKLESIYIDKPQQNVTEVVKEIKSLPFLKRLTNLWMTKKKEDDELFIAREYIKHSNWTEYEQMSVAEYCYVAMILAERFINGKDNLAHILPLLKYFHNRIYQCNLMEFRVSYVVGFKVLGYYLPSAAHNHQLVPIRKLEEFHVAVSHQRSIMDHPDDYTEGIFLLP
ncbi:hypothetical protein DCAR_0935628 [Daucus carota subsp. sativus]|nr:hypothetical protein DCAR_0935628 [Daucus carota subsp. sativus]